MKVLILGGTKFFGKSFALDMHKRGHEVCVFSHTHSNDLPKEIKQVLGERGSFKDLSPLAQENWDIVLDNICFTAEQAQLAVDLFKNNIKHWLFVSTGDVHLVLKGAKSPYTEKMSKTLEVDNKKTEPGGRGGLSTEPLAYGRGKLEAEEVLKKAYKDFRFPYTTIRFPIVIGENDPKNRCLPYWQKIVNGEEIPLPDGGNFNRRYIYIKDCVRALNSVIKNFPQTKNETFHFGDNKTLTLKEFIELSAKLLNKKANTKNISYNLLKEKGYDFTKNSPYYKHGDYVLDINKAEKLLDWVSTPLEVWLKDTMNFYFKQEQ